jgi:hypothetical protein
MLECKSVGAAIGMEGERLPPWLCCRLYVSLICLAYMSRLYVSLICLACMSRLYVLFICLAYMSRCDSKRVCVVASACGGACVLCYARAPAQILKYAVGCGQAAACRTP